MMPSAAAHSPRQPPQSTRSASRLAPPANSPHLAGMRIFQPVLTVGIFSRLSGCSNPFSPRSPSDRHTTTCLHFSENGVFDNRANAPIIPHTPAQVPHMRVTKQIPRP